MTSSAADSTNHTAGTDGALLVVPCEDLSTAISQHEALGFVLTATGPADEPTWAEMGIPGVDVRLDETVDPTAGPKIQLGTIPDQGQPLPAHVAPPPAPSAPLTVKQTLTVLHEQNGDWITGRAGMLYRDLIPDRFGGAFIASHIHVPDAGPVPDYVHHHDVQFQLIFCHRGWVRVVYQDQGPDFALEPGDCILQPPGLRHQVLESSGDLFVTEISCPANHRTSLDHDLVLPNDDLEPARRYGGQLFVRHDCSEAPWLKTPPAEPGFEQQVTAVATATDHHGSVRLVRPLTADAGPMPMTHDGDLRLLFVVAGQAELAGPGGTGKPLAEGSSAAIPASEEFSIVDCSEDALLLDVTYQM